MSRLASFDAMPGMRARCNYCAAVMADTDTPQHLCPSQAMLDRASDHKAGWHICNHLGCGRTLAETNPDRFCADHINYGQGETLDAIPTLEIRDDGKPLAQAAVDLNDEESRSYFRFRAAARAVAEIDVRRRWAAEELLAAQGAWLQVIAPTAKGPG